MKNDDPAALQATVAMRLL